MRMFSSRQAGQPLCKLALVVLIALVSLENISCMRKPLRDQDLALLRDIEQFNARYAQAPWNVSDFRLDGENLSGIRLSQAGIRDAEWDGIVIRGGRFENATFENVTFENLEVYDTQFVHVRFVRCTFRFPRFSEVTFHNAVFEDVTMEEGKVEATLFEAGTVIRALKDQGTTFTADSFVETVFEGGTLLNTRFYDILLEDVTFQGTHLEKVNLDQVEVRNALFRDAMLDRTAFTEGYGEQVTFERCRSPHGLTFVVPRWASMTFRGGTDLQGIELGDAEIDSLTFEEVSGIVDVVVKRSKLDALHITGGRYFDFGLQQTQVAGGRVAQATFSGLSLFGSTVANLDFRAVTVEEYLILDQASLENVRLSEMTYQKPLKVTSEGVNYVNSDRFALP